MSSCLSMRSWLIPHAFLLACQPALSLRFPRLLTSVIPHPRALVTTPTASRSCKRWTIGVPASHLAQHVRALCFPSSTFDFLFSLIFLFMSSPLILLLSTTIADPIMEPLYVSGQVACNGSSSTPPVIHPLFTSAFPVVSHPSGLGQSSSLTCCGQRMLTLTIVQLCTFICLEHRCWSSWVSLFSFLYNYVLTMFVV